MSSSISVPKVSRYDMGELQTQLNNHAATDETITNNGFFPDITLLDIRNVMRIDGTVTNQRLKTATIEAIASVNSELSEYRNTKFLEKSDRTFAQIEAERINGESILVQRYKRAVYCLTVANLNERYRAYDTTKDGGDMSEKLENTVGDLRRDARFAINDIIGRTRITVALI